MLRGRGYLYSIMFIALDIIIGGWFGCVVAVLTFLYAFLIGELCARKKYGTRLCNTVNDIQSEKLQRCFLRVKTKATQRYHNVPQNTKVYIVPDSRIQAYAFGWRSIGVTEGALNLDVRTLEALIAHEYGHIVNGDSVLNMTLTASAFGVIAIIAFYQFALIAIVYLFIIIACLLGLLKLSFLSYLITTKLTGFLKKIGEVVQHGALHLCQIIIKAFSRKGELMADSFACSLGYAFYLRRFLERFDNDAPHRETLFDALYETHPPRDVRLRNLNKEILLLEQHNK